MPTSISFRFAYDWQATAMWRFLKTWDPTVKMQCGFFRGRPCAIVKASVPEEVSSVASEKRRQIEGMTYEEYRATL